MQKTGWHRAQLTRQEEDDKIGLQRLSKNPRPLLSVSKCACFIPGLCPQKEESESLSPCLHWRTKRGGGCLEGFRRGHKQTFLLSGPPSRGRRSGPFYTQATRESLSPAQLSHPPFSGLKSESEAFLPPPSSISGLPPRERGFLNYEGVLEREREREATASGGGGSTRGARPSSSPSSSSSWMEFGAW